MRNKCVALVAAVPLAGTAGFAQQKPAAPKSLRLYIFDCGVIPDSAFKADGAPAVDGRSSVGKPPSHVDPANAFGVGRVEFYE